MNTTTAHDCKDELRDVELKATPARLAILKLLEETTRPLDVAEMIAYLKTKNIDADQTTVFRIINIFTERGITKQVHLNEDRAHYELTSQDDHHHLICDTCGKIEDISDCAIPNLESDIEKKKGFLVKRHSLEFFGVCKDCQI